MKRARMAYPFSRIALFLVSILGWGATFFGGWIAARGVLFYDWDAVLMGTGGGIALGGLLVTTLTIGAQAQIATARDTAALRAAMKQAPSPAPTEAQPRTAPKLRAVPALQVNRTEPKVTRKG
jgi:hypothetical protein